MKFTAGNWQSCAFSATANTVICFEWLNSLWIQNRTHQGSQLCGQTLEMLMGLWQGTQLLGEFLSCQLFNTEIEFRALPAVKVSTSKVMSCKSVCMCTLLQRLTVINWLRSGGWQYLAASEFKCLFIICCHRKPSLRKQQMTCYW